MDSIKKQLRFFQVLIAVLAVVVVAQCTFWLNIFSTPASSDYNPVQKVKELEEQRKVIAPAVSAVFQFMARF
jgi:hypothetical protein